MRLGFRLYLSSYLYLIRQPCLSEGAKKLLSIRFLLVCEFLCKFLERKPGRIILRDYILLKRSLGGSKRGV